MPCGQEGRSACSSLSAAPSWSLPELDLDGYSRPRGQCHTLNGSLQNPAENGVDVNHFSPVHGWSNPVLEPPEADGHQMTMRSTLVLLGQRLLLDITMHGLGCMAAQGQEAPPQESILVQGFKSSLERALEIAARNPSARYWGIEVRPLMHEADVQP